MRPGGRPPGAVRSRRRADPAARSRVARLLRRSTGRIASAIRPTVFRGEGEPYPHPSPAALRVASLPRGTFTTACQGLWPHRRSSVARVRTPSSRRRRAASAGASRWRVPASGEMGSLVASCLCSSGQRCRVSSGRWPGRQSPASRRSSTIEAAPFARCGGRASRRRHGWAPMPASPVRLPSGHVVDGGDRVGRRRRRLPLASAPGFAAEALLLGRRRTRSTGRSGC